jgi:hypothetical protein
MARRSVKAASRPRPVPNACRQCGLILDGYERQYCGDCLPKFKEQRTEKLVGAARAVLVAMRASPNDPAKTPEAVAKRVAAHAERRQVALLWDKENPGPHDVERFRREIAPLLEYATLPAMMRATGLSSVYCWRIKRGERIPHPMHWGPLATLASST